MMNCIVELQIIHYIVVVSNYNITWAEDDVPRRCRKEELVRLNEGLHA